MSIRDIVNLIEAHHETVARKMRDCGIEIRGISEATRLAFKKRGILNDFDRRIFNKIDDIRSAYLLGMAYAEAVFTRHGLIVESRNYDVIERAGSLLNINKLSDRGDGRYIFGLSSIDMVKDLKEIGFPKGREDAEVPELEDWLVRHFIRGYLEMRGLASNDTEIMEFIGEWFESHGIRNSVVSATRRLSTSISIHEEDVDAALELLYDNVPTEYYVRSARSDLKEQAAGMH